MKRKIAIILMACLLLLAVGCEKKASDDAVALAGYLCMFDDPEGLDITTLERYSFDGNIDIYRIVWIDHSEEDEMVELLIKHVKESPLVTLCFWADMNSSQGMNSDVKELWENRDSQAKASTSFNAENITRIKSEAVDYIAKSREAEKEQ